MAGVSPVRAGQADHIGMGEGHVGGRLHHPANLASNTGRPERGILLCLEGRLTWPPLPVLPQVEWERCFDLPAGLQLGGRLHPIF